MNNLEKVAAAIRAEPGIERNLYRLAKAAGVSVSGADGCLHWLRRARMDPDVAAKLRNVCAAISRNKGKPELLAAANVRLQELKPHIDW